MPADTQGVEFKVGQKVAKAAKYFQTDGLHIQVMLVTKVNGEKVYLNGGTQPLRFPERVAIIQGD